MNQEQGKIEATPQQKPMKKRSLKKRLILFSAILILLAGAGAAVYFLWLKPNWPALTYSYEAGGKDKTKEAETTIYDLLDSDNPDDIQRAEKAVSIEQEAARKSGDTAYILQTDIWKANFLVEEGSYDQALTVLLTYEDNAANLSQNQKNDLYLAISWVYRNMGNQEKTYEYFGKLKHESLGE